MGSEGNATANIVVANEGELKEIEEDLGKPSIPISIEAGIDIGVDKKRKMITSFFQGSIEVYDAMLSEKNSLHKVLRDKLKDMELYAE